jgi:hypothetical protein
VAVRRWGRGRLLQAQPLKGEPTGALVTGLAFSSCLVEGIQRLAADAEPDVKPLALGAWSASSGAGASVIRGHQAFSALNKSRSPS